MIQAVAVKHWRYNLWLPFRCAGDIERLVALLVISVLLLGSVVCIVHCHIAHWYAETATGMPGLAGVTFYLCHGTPDDQSKIPASFDTQIFYSQRSLDPLSQTTLLTPLLLTAMLELLLLHLGSQVHPMPPTPPPRTA